MELFTRAVSNVTVCRTLDVQGKYSMLVNWDIIVPYVPDVQGFNIYRAELDDEVKINKSVVTQNFYLDNDAPVFPGQDWYYKVTCISATSGESLASYADKVNVYTVSAVGLAGRIQSALKETVRRLAFGMNIYGETVKIFIKRTYGPYCPVCYNNLSGRGADPQCATCYGTGVDGGYDIYATRAIITEQSKRIMESREGLRETYIPRGVIANYPLLHDGDGIKRQDGKAYMISESSPQMIQNFLIEQQFTLVQLPVGHVFSKLG